jgi:cytochrome c oxidase subunit 3
MDIPYTVSARPDTGLYNGKLGIWLFLASEAMLFGGFFSAYIFLRIGGGESWPVHGETHTQWYMGLINTIVLITSSMTMVLAWMSLKARALGRFNFFMGVTVAAAVAFMVIKSIEYNHKFHGGYFPSTSPFFSIYFVMTGLHGVHVIGGAIVLAYHWASVNLPFCPGYQIYRKNPEQIANRVECAGLFWHLVDLIWIFLFPLYYLL